MDNNNFRKKCFSKKKSIFSRNFWLESKSVKFAEVSRKLSTMLIYQVFRKVNWWKSINLGHWLASNWWFFILKLSSYLETIFIFAFYIQLNWVFYESSLSWRKTVLIQFIFWTFRRCIAYGSGSRWPVMEILKTMHAGERVENIRP